MGEAFFTPAADRRWRERLRGAVGIAADADAGTAFDLPGRIEQKIVPLRAREMSKIALELGRQLIERTVIRPAEALHAALQDFAAAEYAVLGRLEMLGAFGVVDEFALPPEAKNQRFLAGLDEKARQP